MQKGKIVIENPVSYIFGLIPEGPILPGKEYELTEAQIATLMDTASVYLVNDDSTRALI